MDVPARTSIHVPFTGQKPTHALDFSAAYDLHSDQWGYVHPRQYRLFKTGFKMDVPPGFAGLVLSRSGLAAKHGICVLNGIGLIDPGYHGDVGVILINHGVESFEVHPGDRIAQLLFIETAEPMFDRDPFFDSRHSARGDGGFGSTGI